MRLGFVGLASRRRPCGGSGPVRAGFRELAPCLRPCGLYSSASQRSAWCVCTSAGPPEVFEVAGPGANALLSYLLGDLGIATAMGVLERHVTARTETALQALELVLVCSAAAGQEFRVPEAFVPSLTAAQSVRSSALFDGARQAGQAVGQGNARSVRRRRAQPPSAVRIRYNSDIASLLGRNIAAGAGVDSRCVADSELINDRSSTGRT